MSATVEVASKSSCELWRVGDEYIRASSFADGHWELEQLDDDGVWVRILTDRDPDTSFDELIEVLLCRQ